MMPADAELSCRLMFSAAFAESGAISGVLTTADGVSRHGVLAGAGLVHRR